jgi:hypothetical protein
MGRSGVHQNPRVNEPPILSAVMVNQQRGGTRIGPRNTYSGRVRTGLATIVGGDQVHQQWNQRGKSPENESMRTLLLRS